MTGKDRRDEQQPCTAEHGALRPDVAGRVEDARCDAEPCAAGEHARDRPHGRSGAECRDRDPPDDRRRRRAPARAGAPGEREREQRQARDRDPDAHPVPRRERPSRVSLHEQREQADPAGGRRLDERERRQRQCRHVERPPRDPGQEAGEPAPVGEQEPKRRDRPANPQRGQRRSRSVLREERPGERRRRGEREHEAGRNAHSRFLPLNGRYASAASAAMPTRGRSRLRS